MKGSSKIYSLLIVKNRKKEHNNGETRKTAIILLEENLQFRFVVIILPFRYGSKILKVEKMGEDGEPYNFISFYFVPLVSLIND